MPVLARNHYNSAVLISVFLDFFASLGGYFSFGLLAQGIFIVELSGKL